MGVRLKGPGGKILLREKNRIGILALQIGSQISTFGYWQCISFLAPYFSLIFHYQHLQLGCAMRTRQKFGCKMRMREIHYCGGFLV
jgi:hypothetical protein